MHHIKATVTRANGKTKPSRGFSLSELHGAGLTRQDAKKIGIPLDVKRKSAHEVNITTLKAHANDAKAKAEVQPKPTETEAAPEKPKKKR